ncbi:3-oxoacyl-[acyl-carrier-protein] synthase 3 [Streptomyces badius]
MSSQPVGILSTGAYVPERVVGNEELAPRIGVTAEWIERKTGIRARRWADPSEATSEMAVAAATRALEQAGLTADRIDHLIVTTSTGDAPLPPTACLVQAELGAHRAAAFDLNIACSGFVHGLAVAHGLVAQNPGSHALVVAADLWSRFVDFGDRGTAALLADGAGAAVVGAVPGPYGILGTDLLSHGDESSLLVIKAGGSRKPASHATVDEGGHFLRMRGREVSDFVLGKVPQAVKDLLAKTGVRREDIAHFVPHQANGVLLGRLAGAERRTRRRCGERAAEGPPRTGAPGPAADPVPPRSATPRWTVCRRPCASADGTDPLGVRHIPSAAPPCCPHG